MWYAGGTSWDDVPEARRGAKVVVYYVACLGLSSWLCSPGIACALASPQGFAVWSLHVCSSFQTGLRSTCITCSVQFSLSGARRGHVTFGQIVTDLGQDWAELRQVWGILVADFGHAWAELGQTWGKLETELEQAWAELGQTWGRLGMGWGDLGQTWGRLGAYLKGLGRVVGSDLRQAWAELGRTVA
jgi:hypothetical protein